MLEASLNQLEQLVVDLMQKNAQLTEQNTSLGQELAQAKGILRRHDMGYRLSKIYTRTGDKGETGLGDGRRVPKDHPRVEAIGEVDSLNSQLGLLLAGLAELGMDEVSTVLAPCQHRLFDLGGELAMPSYQALNRPKWNGWKRPSMCGTRNWGR